jgi:hypothetical protein
MSYCTVIVAGAKEKIENCEIEAEFPATDDIIARGSIPNWVVENLALVQAGCPNTPPMTGKSLFDREIAETPPPSLPPS